MLHQPKYLQTFQEDGQKYQGPAKDSNCTFQTFFFRVLTLEDVPCGTMLLLDNVLLDLVKVVVPRWVGLELCRTVNQLEVVNVLGPSLGAGSASLLPVPPPLPGVGGWRLSWLALLMDEDRCLDLVGRAGRWSWGILLPLLCGNRPIFTIVCCCC